MSKNGIIAALWTAAIIGGFAGVLYVIKNYPDFMWYVVTGGIGLMIYFVFVYPLWDTIKWELDRRDEIKKEACNLDLDENDKAQIG